MSRHQISHISKHVCQCPSKGTVTVPAIGDKPSFKTYRSPICNALQGLKKVSDADFLTMCLEEKLSQATINLIVLMKQKVDSEELVNDLLKAHVDMMLVKEKEYNAMLEFERQKTASAIVRIMPVPLPSKSALKPSSPAGKNSPSNQPKKVLWSSPIAKKSVDSLAPPLPANFMVGTTYVSGIASGFDDIGF